MSRRWKRVAPAAGVLVALQGAAILIYILVEGHRGASNKLPFHAETLRGDTAPDLDLERPDGTPFALSALRGRFVLVHFWATWCPPCRDELPGLLALGSDLRRAGDVELLAVSVDRDWDAVGKFFGGSVPTGVVRARDTDPHQRYGVSTLPDTYLVSPTGAMTLRFGGARDWRSDAAKQRIQEELAK